MPEVFDPFRPSSSHDENTGNPGFLLLSCVVTLHPVTVKCGKICGTNSWVQNEYLCSSIQRHTLTIIYCKYGFVKSVFVFYLSKEKALGKLFYQVPLFPIIMRTANAPSAPGSPGQAPERFQSTL